MSSSESNPLSGYFRQPAIYMKLPSAGRWWPKTSLRLPPNEEIAVYPMTAKDEVSIRTPDALLNGQGVVDVIQSCCPAIVNAWDMPNVDSDAVLIAIRIATFGPRLGITSKCRHCSADNEHDVNLGAILADIECANYDRLIDFKDLKFKLRPQTYRDLNRNSMVTFEEQRMISAIEQDGVSDTEKLAEISRSMKKIVDLGIESCVSSTEYIELPNGERVSDRQHIKEFYNNAENEIVRLLQEFLTNVINNSKVKPISVNCESCSGEYETDINFDFASFFAKGF